MLKSITTGSLLSFVIVLLAYLFSRRSDDILQEKLSSVLHGLQKLEKKFPLTSPKKVAIGLGGCKDVIIPASSLLQFLENEAPANASNHNALHSLNDLKESFAHFFHHGAAAERYMSDKILFDTLVERAMQLSEVRYDLGGNAVQMASRLAKEGCNILLGAKLSHTTQNLLPSQIQFTTGSDQDDIHLILEYDSKEVWGKYTSPRANRFIIHSDKHNSELAPLAEFSSRLKNFQPDLLVIGGLHIMDQFPYEAGLREKKLLEVKTILAAQPPDLRVHLEMASISNEEFFNELVTHILPYSDSLGMNEQELPNLHSMLQYGNVTTLSDSYPRVATILDQMRELFRLLNQMKGAKRVSRIHVHTLAFQAMMVKKGSSWKNTLPAAAKASLTAYRHVCGSIEVDLTKARIIMDDSFSTTRTVGATRIEFNEKKPVACWLEDNEELEVCVAPVLVCTKVLQTVAAGDNISAAGLVLQI